MRHMCDNDATDPKALKWHLVMDCLTLINPDLVRLVAQDEGIDSDRPQGKSGILKSMADAFLVTQPTEACFTLRQSIVPG